MLAMDDTDMHPCRNTGAGGRDHNCGALQQETDPRSAAGKPGSPTGPTAAQVGSQFQGAMLCCRPAQDGGPWRRGRLWLTSWALTGVPSSCLMRASPCWSTGQPLISAGGAAASRPASNGTMAEPAPHTAMHTSQAHSNTMHFSCQQRHTHTA